MDVKSYQEAIDFMRNRLYGISLNKFSALTPEGEAYWQYAEDELAGQIAELENALLTVKYNLRAKALNEVIEELNANV